MLIANNVNLKRYFHGNLRLNIKNLSFKLELGSISSIIGQSGVGKSTIASLLSGLLKPDSGQVTFQNKIVDQPYVPISFVIQDYKSAVFPWLTVEDNIKIATYKPIDRNGAYTYDDIIEILDIPSTILKEHPNHLSGGQIQRVQIARALLSGCEYIILDEPTSSLDMKFRIDLQSILLSLVEKFNVGILLITHDIEQAIFIANKVLVVKETNNKTIFIKHFNGFSHKMPNISVAQNTIEYRKLFNEIYKYLFYEN